MTMPSQKPIDRKRISEALLADRLGVNEPWIERWKEGDKWREESCAPDRLPDFIRKNHTKPEIKDIESDIERLVTAGCQQQVVYFCLAQLSPEAAWLRAEGEKEPVFTEKNRDWSASELHEKLNDFREDHPRLYKRLAGKLRELHEFAAR